MRKTSVFPSLRNLAGSAAAVLLATLVATPALAGFTLSDDFGGEPMPLSGVKPLSLPLGFEYEVPPFEEGEIAPYTRTMTWVRAADIIGPGTIQDLDVMIRLRHPEPSALQIFLRHEIAPDDVVVAHLVAPGVMGCSDNDMPSSARFNQDVFLYLDDQAQADIHKACTRSIPSIDGRFFPTLALDGNQSNLLASFNGRPINQGFFELVIRDWGGGGSSRGELIDWAVIINNPIDGDVAPRQLTPTSPPLQSGNNILTEQDYVVSAFHLLEYNTLDDRVKAGRFYGYLDEVPGDSIGLFDNLRRYLPDDPFDVAEFYAVRRSSPTEFLRMDSAPASSGGDGIISVADFVQTARYVASLDELQPSVGPLSRYDRTVTAVTYTEDPEDPEKLILSPGLFRGQSDPTKVSVIMRSSNAETEVGFGLEFDPELLELVDVVKGPAIPENSIFQVDRNVDVDPGLVGLRVGVMPDDTFAALPLPKPVLSRRVFENGEWKWREVINTKVDSSATEPMFSHNHLTSVYELDFSGGQPKAIVRFYVDNEVEQPIRDYRFTILYDRTKMVHLNAEGGDFGVAPTIRPTIAEPYPSGLTIVDGVDNVVGDYILYELSASLDAETAAFSEGLLAEMEFTIIRGFDADLSPNVPSLRLLRSARQTPDDALKANQVFNVLTGDPTFDPFFNTVLNDNLTGGRGRDGQILNRARRVIPPPASSPVGTEFGLEAVRTDPGATTGTLSVYLRADSGVETITRVRGLLSFDSSKYEFVGLNGLAFDTDPDDPTEVADGGTTTLEVDLNSETGLLNGRIFRADFEVLPGAAGGEPESRAIRFLPRPQSPNAIAFTVGGQTAIFQSFNAESLMADPFAEKASVALPAVASSFSYNPPRSPNVPDFRPSQATVFGVIEPPVTGLDEGTTVRASINAFTNVVDNEPAPVVHAYRFYLTFDATKLRLMEDSATAGADGFSGLPTFRSAEEVVYNDQSIKVLQLPNRSTNNMVSVLVEAQDLESSFVGGTLLSVGFEVIANLQTAPALKISSVPVFNENIELAHFYFRARPGTGTVATDLRFVDYPLFDGLAVRNPGGMPMPANFVDGSLTVIDTSDSFPTVRVRDTVLRAGEEGNVQVVLDSQGVENATGFTLHFDNENLELLSIGEGRDISTGAFFFTNPNAQVAPGDHAEDDPMGHANETGQVKLLTALSPGASFAPGERILANLRFKTREDTEAYDTHFRFTKLGDTLEIVDPQALVLVSRFPEGTVRVAGTECSYTLEPSVAEFDTPGGEGSFTVQTSSGCPWVATSSASWITITAGFSGSNVGTVSYEVAPYGGSGTRTGTIEVAGEAFTIVQGGCMVVLSPEGKGFSEAGGTGSFDVLTTSNCSWTASSNSSWITITGNPFGTGEGTVSYTVAENVGQPRTGTIAVGGRTFTVTQDICVYTLDSPSVAQFPAEGGQGLIEFSTNSFCEWVVENNAPWITGINPISGSGDGAVTFNVAANSGIGRDAILRIGNMQVRVRQDAVAGCQFSISPRVAAFTNAGGEGRFLLSTTAGDCSWQLVARNDAGDPVSWLRIASDGVGNPTDGAGTGSTEVRFTVDPNVVEVGATADRQAFIRLQGEGGPAIRILQAGGPAMEPRFQFTYSNDSQGWEVEDMSALFTPPLTNQRGEEGPFAIDPPGRLSFAVEDNESTFGIWASPAAVLERPAAEDDLLRASWVLSTDRANPVGVPATRLRFSTRDFHQTSEFTLNSVAPAPLAPRAGMDRTLGHAFRPVAGTNQLNMFFDVVNFSGLNAADASVALERLTLTRRSLLGQGRVELTRLLGMEQHREGWVTVTTPEMADPLFAHDSRGLRIAGDPAVDHDSEITFGYWAYEPAPGSGLPVVTLEAGRLYQVSFVVSARHSRQLEVLPNRVPTFRLRLNETTLATSSMVSVVSVSDEYPMPSLDRKVTYHVLLEGRPEIAGAQLLPSFDFLFTPDMDNDPDISLILETLTVRSFVAD